MQLRKWLNNTDASAIPIILFVFTIVTCGALYTLLFLQIAIPSLESYIPNSDSKTFIMMGIYAIPLIIIIVGIISLILAGLKRQVWG